MQETRVPSWSQEDPLGEGNSNPLQNSFREKSMFFTPTTSWDSHLGLWGLQWIQWWWNISWGRPTEQSSLCALSVPSVLGSVGTISYKLCRKGSSPWLVPGHKPLPPAESLFPNEWMPVELLELPPSSKQRHQDFPWRLTSELPPPQLGDPAHPQLMALRSQHCPESSLQMEKPHPPLDTRAYRFIFSFRVTFTYLT